MDIRVTPRDDLNVEELRKLAEVVPSDYSEINDQFSVTAAIQLGELANQSITPTKEGFQFKSTGTNRLFQAQRNGWSFNQLAPYEGWEIFSPAGRELWMKYREIAKPKAITRIAVRYINRLELPLPLEDFKQYILAVPDISMALPQAFSNFFMQVHIPHADILAMLVLNVALIAPASEASVPIVLDIDLFRERDVPQTEKDIWVFFETLRDKKNKIFEACVTEAMKERFR